MTNFVENQKLYENHLSQQRGSLSEDRKELSTIKIRRSVSSQIEQRSLRKRKSPPLAVFSELPSEEQCRICFKNTKIDMRINITSSIVSRFLVLTGIALSMKKKYPQTICKSCDLDLINYCNFRNDLIFKQRKFYNTVKAQVKNIPSVEIKTEFVESGMCYPMKTEIEVEAKQLLPQIIVIKEEFSGLAEEVPLNLPPAWHDYHDEPTEPEGEPDQGFHHDFKQITKKSIIQKHKRKKQTKPKDESTPEKNKTTPHTEWCPHCNENVPSLKHHRLYVHNIDWKYQCDLCPFVNKNIKSTEVHMYRTHTEEGVAFMKLRKASYRKNSKKYLAKKQFCSHCGKFVQNIKSHLRSANRLDEYDCDVCGKKLNGRSAIEIHIERIHLKLSHVICHLCSRNFYNESELKYHIKNVHDERKYICSYCGASYGSNQILRKHVRAKHTVGQAFGCDFCEKRFINASLLRYHRNVHLDNREFVCVICKKGFHSNKRRTLHSCIIPFKLRCEVPGCSSAISRCDTFISHVRKHNDITDDVKETLTTRARARWKEHCKRMESEVEKLTKSCKRNL